ncbi:MAG: hypothetical protein E7514_00085 [Ruminococcaceae bacterium]|nr:hypothetical protein [Oscillospiraceae bacterium]
MKRTLFYVCLAVVMIAVLFCACGSKEDGKVGSKASTTVPQSTTMRTAGEVVSEAGSKVGEAATGIGDTAGEVVTGAADAVRDAVTGAGEIVSEVVS